MILQNLHTHSTYCDGNDTPEEMVKEAIDRGFSSLGFSIHSYTPFSELYHFPFENQGLYIKEISRLKEKYKDTFPIFCGIEFEMYSDTDIPEYDYIIGSVHYLKKDEELFSIDRDADTLKSIIANRFGGDGLALAKYFYETVARLPERIKFDIAGHFDLITKNLESYALFDSHSKEYKSYALEALHAVSEHCDIFEINTGAIARGYRTTPYPDTFILEELKKLGKNVLVSSDCHNKKYLDCHFKECYELLKSLGFKHTVAFDGTGFKEVPLED